MREYIFTSLLQLLERRHLQSLCRSRLSLVTMPRCSHGKDGCNIRMADWPDHSRFALRICGAHSIVVPIGSHAWSLSDQDPLRETSDVRTMSKVNSRALLKQHRIVAKHTIVSTIHTLACLFDTMGGIPGVASQPQMQLHLTVYLLVRGWEVLRRPCALLCQGTRDLHFLLCQYGL